MIWLHKCDGVITGKHPRKPRVGSVVSQGGGQENKNWSDQEAKELRNLADFMERMAPSKSIFSSLSTPAWLGDFFRASYQRNHHRVGDQPWFDVGDYISVHLELGGSVLLQAVREDGNLLEQESRCSGMIEWATYNGMVWSDHMKMLPSVDQVGKDGCRYPALIVKPE